MKQLAMEAAALSIAATFAFTISAVAQETTNELPENGTYIELPAEFEQAVRGCTLDGYIYRFTYNTIVNFDDVETSFHQMVQPDPDALIGVSGSEGFMAALKTLSRDIQDSMQSVGGLLIDEASSDIVEGEIFTEILQSSTGTISQQIESKYGIEIIITTGEPKQQGGRCPAAPGFGEESVEQIAPAPAP